MFLCIKLNVETSSILSKVFGVLLNGSRINFFLLLFSNGTTLYVVFKLA